MRMTDCAISVFAEEDASFGVVFWKYNNLVEGLCETANCHELVIWFGNSLKYVRIYVELILPGPDSERELRLPQATNILVQSDKLELVS